MPQHKVLAINFILFCQWDRMIEYGIEGGPLRFYYFGMAGEVHCEAKGSRSKMLITSQVGSTLDDEHNN